jgi:hypothetical protein
MSSFVNTGYAKKNNNIIEDTSVTVNVADADTLIMSKTVDKPDQFYFQGDSIVFTITISLPASAESKMYGITFEDQIPPQVTLPTTSPYGVTTTEGNIVPVTDNLVKITGIDLDPGETVTITITGTIA